MTAYDLSQREALLINEIRRQPPEAQDAAIMRALVRVPPSEPKPEPTPDNPPQHATWEEWTDSDFQRVLCKDEQPPEEEIALYLIGYLSVRHILPRSVVCPAGGRTEDFVQHMAQALHEALQFYKCDLVHLIYPDEEYRSDRNTAWS